MLLVSHRAIETPRCPCQDRIHRSRALQRMTHLRSIDSQPPPSDCSTLDCSLLEVAQPLRCSHMQLQRCRDSAGCRLPARTPLPDTCTTQGSQMGKCRCPQLVLCRLLQEASAEGQLDAKSASLEHTGVPTCQCEACQATRGGTITTQSAF